MFNVIDGAVVISTLIEYALANQFGKGGSATGLRILRFGRVARTFKVARQWPALQQVRKGRLEGGLRGGCGRVARAG